MIAFDRANARFRRTCLVLGTSAVMALAGAASATETAGFTVGQPHEIPDLIAGHIEAGADEVIFSVPFADASAIRAIGESLGLGTA